MSDATSPSDASDDETDLEVRTQSSYAPAGEAEMHQITGADVRVVRSDEEREEGSESGSSDEWEEAR